MRTYIVNKKRANGDMNKRRVNCQSLLNHLFFIFAVTISPLIIFCNPLYNIIPTNIFITPLQKVFLIILQFSTKNDHKHFLNKVRKVYYTSYFCKNYEIKKLPLRIFFPYGINNVYQVSEFSF